MSPKEKQREMDLHYAEANVARTWNSITTSIGWHAGTWLVGACSPATRDIREVKRRAYATRRDETRRASLHSLNTYLNERLRSEKTRALHTRHVRSASPRAYEPVHIYICTARPPKCSHTEPTPAVRNGEGKVTPEGVSISRVQAAWR